MWGFTKKQSEPTTEEAAAPQAGPVTRTAIIETTKTDDTEEQEQLPADYEAVNVGLFWDEWTRCIGSRYQRDQMYRVGNIDTCTRQWKDFKIAGKAKIMQLKDPHGAKAMINTTYYKKRTTISPTAGAIWELKEKPGWD